MAGDQPGVQRPVGTEHLEHAVGQPRVGGTDDLTLRLPGMRERTQHVEDGRDPQACTDGAGEAHGRMEGPGEGEADPVLGDLGGQALRRDLYVHTQELQHIEGAGGRRRPSVAVLADGGACARRHEAGHGRDVQRRLTTHHTPARSDDVDRPLRQGQGFCRRDHGLDQPGRLLSGLALDLQPDQEACDLRRLGLPTQDLGEDGLGLFGRQVLTFAEAFQEARPAAIVIQSHPSDPVGQAVRRRRRIRRRSRSVVPPQMPVGSRRNRA